MSERQDPVRVRNRRRVLRAASEFIAKHPIEQLTMRRLAIEAEVSVATLYNLIGTRNEVIKALSLEVLTSFDDAFSQINVTERLERTREIISAVIKIVTTHVPRSLVLAAFADERLASDLETVWRSRLELAKSIGSMVKAGELEGRLSPTAVAKQVWIAYSRYLRLWAAELIDASQFRAGSLYVLDLCLLALATKKLRTCLLVHAASLEKELRDVL